jgi:hypothetical protein
VKHVRLIGVNSAGKVYEQVRCATELAERCEHFTAPRIKQLAVWLLSAPVGARYSMMTFTAEIVGETPNG